MIEQKGPRYPLRDAQLAQRSTNVYITKNHLPYFNHTTISIHAGTPDRPRFYVSKICSELVENWLFWPRNGQFWVIFDQIRAIFRNAKFWAVRSSGVYGNGCIVKIW